MPSSKNLPKPASTQMTSWCFLWRPIARADHSAAGSSHRLLPFPDDEHPFAGCLSREPRNGCGHPYSDYSACLTAYL